MMRTRPCFVVHVTDGAPRDAALRSCPDKSRDAYARARSQELLDALAIAGVAPDHVRWLGATDQEACFVLGELTRRLLGVLELLRPACAIVHAYEGGHPDHDAAAFIAHAAVRLLRKRGGAVPVLYEMASYHAAEGRLVAGEFIGNAGAPEIALALTRGELECKRRMPACFGSQTQALSELARPLDVERYRVAVRPDFSQPAHTGRLHYEALGWPLSAEHFCLLAVAAQRGLARGGLGWDLAS
jgi:LmbE family N-acetylglucosaminyl deacetylase